MKKEGEREGRLEPIGREYQTGWEERRREEDGRRKEKERRMGLGKGGKKQERNGHE